MFLTGSVQFVPAQSPDTLRRAANDTSAIARPQTWKRHTLGLRLSVGIQRSFYAEGGFSFQKLHYSPEFLFAASSFYFVTEWTPPPSAERKQIFGFKGGLELVRDLSANCIEFKYQTDFDKTDFVITPKIGLGLSSLNIYYGYNFSFNKYPFPNIWKHQFSLSFKSNVFHKKKK